MTRTKGLGAAIVLTVAAVGGYWYYSPYLAIKSMHAAAQKKDDANVASDLQIHVVLDNYATHKHPKVLKWLAKHKRFHMHFTATSASWMNMVERFFRNLSEDRLKRGVFKSVDELVCAIELFVLAHNENPKPFIWTATARDILEKVIRARTKLNTVQTA